MIALRAPKLHFFLSDCTFSFIFSASILPGFLVSHSCFSAPAEKSVTLSSRFVILACLSSIWHTFVFHAARFVFRSSTSKGFGLWASPFLGGLDLELGPLFVFGAFALPFHVYPFWPSFFCSFRDAFVSREAFDMSPPVCPFFFHA